MGIPTTAICVHISCNASQKIIVFARTYIAYTVSSLPLSKWRLRISPDPGTESMPRVTALQS